MHCLEVLCSQFVITVIFINQDNFPQSQRYKDKDDIAISQMILLQEHKGLFILKVGMWILFFYQSSIP